MEELKEEIRQAVHNEHIRAVEEFGDTYSSSHESYAVLLEEIEEAMHEGDICKQQLLSFWDYTKKNSPASYKTMNLEWMQECAEMAAAEWVQVAAVCIKALKLYKHDDDNLVDDEYAESDKEQASKEKCCDNCKHHSGSGCAKSAFACLGTKPYEYRYFEPKER